MEKFNILIVGSGGIGCELLKTLVLTGYQNIDIIDLDTIEFSNLNRQFLFNRSSIGKSKALVAKQSVLKLNPNLNINSYQDDIMDSKFDLDYFKKFNVVLNALDNRAARSHVNKMCISAEIPLIDGGTSGFLGQVHVIKKNFSSCYDCEPIPSAKTTFPVCTIRNNPSKMIHCIVWAKYIFENLFSNDNKSEEIIPQDNKLSKVDKITIEEFKVIMITLFVEKIIELISSKDSWEDRKKPIPLESKFFQNPSFDIHLSQIESKKIFSMEYYYSILVISFINLQQKYSKFGFLKWDKDDDSIVVFTAALANLRAYCFHLELENIFEIKAMAGNIIPAVATTNAIISGLMVVECNKILNNQIEKCQSVYVIKESNHASKMFVPCKIVKPNENCYVCGIKPKISICINLKEVTINQLKMFLNDKLKMHDLDVTDLNTGRIIISSDAEDMLDNSNISLWDLGMKNNTFLLAEDFFTDSKLEIYVKYNHESVDGIELIDSNDEFKLNESKKRTKLLPEIKSKMFKDNSSDCLILDSSESDLIME